MNTYAVIVFEKTNDLAFEKALKGSSVFGSHNLTSGVCYSDDKDFFDSACRILIDKYKSLYDSNKQLIDKFKDKVKPDDFILGQMKSNLKRFEEHSYRYPEEWNIIFFDGTEISHVDSYEYYESIKKSSEDNFYMFIADVPK
ncbi:MAG TPA: hypothetical protein PLS66_10730 [Tepiditoga sp.]|nr:hypothetical protein [Tepiditoga sp.]